MPVFPFGGNYSTIRPYSLFPIAYSLLPIAYCLLPIPYCLFPIAYCLLLIPYCLFPTLQPLTLVRFYLKRYSVFVLYVSPGRRAVDGKSGRFGEFG